MAVVNITITDVEEEGTEGCRVKVDFGDGWKGDATDLNEVMNNLTDSQYMAAHILQFVRDYNEAMTTDEFEGDDNIEPIIQSTPRILH
jgi:hypothetical protein